jgi:hypothetical protein
LNVQFARWMASFSSMLCDLNSECRFGVEPPTVFWNEAWKKAGLAVPHAAAGQLTVPPGMVIVP